MKDIDLVSRYRLQELDFQDRVNRSLRIRELSMLETLRKHYIECSNNAENDSIRLHYWYMEQTVLSVSNNDSLLTGEYIGSRKHPFS
jgi:hypothetical protein